MRESRKDRDMRMLRSAGLSLASADRLAGSKGAGQIGAYAVGGLAIVALAGAGVFAMNLPHGAATQDSTAVASSVEPDAAELGTASTGPALALPVPLDTGTVANTPSSAALAELPWITAQVDTPTVQEEAAPVPEAADCVTDLSAAVSGLILNFEPGSAEIRPQDYDALVSIGRQTATCPEARVQVAGHSDSSGTDAINLALSWERADSFVQVLDGLGMDVSQFETVGFGARAPLAQGSDTDEEINRRIELRVLREGGQL